LSCDSKREQVFSVLIGPPPADLEWIEPAVAERIPASANRVRKQLQKQVGEFALRATQALLFFMALSHG
jgi:hypothetical protein